MTAHYRGIEQLLRAIPGLRGGVHLGAVPATLPQDTAGRVYPYAVIWAGVLSPVPDDDISGRTYQAGQAGEFTVTVASGDWAWTTPAARDVKHALTGALDGRVKPQRLQQSLAQVMTDPAERPARYYIPLTWTLTDHA
ncbi:hypothetical protein [Micrococcus luteus]|uniref:hypothetical protein n=1 Tax=Micrococcus luteus TaxID=1270 RepID=UPI0023030BFE|nr:hypothetical protein [Micrococcus luteus]